VHLLARSLILLVLLAAPDVERFTVRPNIKVTAEYGPDGQACRIRIEPSPDPAHDKISQPPAPMEEVTDVLDEVVPPEMRGKFVGQGEQIPGQCRGAAIPTEYERAEIRLYYGLCDKVPTVHGVDVYFKRPVCEDGR
jgi:hypothetical protein